MSYFVHRMLGHYLMDEAEEGADLGGADDVATDDVEEELDQEEEDDEPEELDEIVISLGEEPAEQEQDEKSAPAWVKELRKSQRELQRENRELKAKLTQAPEKAKAPEVGPKPSLEGCDYDADKFEADLIAWQDRKRKADQVVAEQQKAEQEANEAWQARRAAYGEQKAKLKVSNYEDAESAIAEIFSETQQAMIVDVADNAAHVIYALGRNPAEAKKLAEIKSPTKFIRELARLEDTKLKVQPKAKPAPEGTISGTAPKSGGGDAKLENLRAAAEKSGDYSKVHAYKREQKAKQKA